MSGLTKYETRLSDLLLALVQYGVSDTMAQCEWTDAMANAWCDSKGLFSPGGREMTRLCRELRRSWPVASYWTKY